MLAGNRAMPGQGAGLVAAAVFAALMTAAIWALSPALARFEDPAAGIITYDSSLPKEERAAHYEWKLNEPDALTRLSAWGLYAAHQLLAWACIAWGARRAAARVRAGGTRFQASVDPAGAAFFIVNATFALAHLWQTHAFYDGLAQDVPVMSSQGSVIVMLVLVLIMQNDRRGLIFGWKAPIPKAAAEFVKRWHGYYVAWALIYTFWFHPTTGTFGHLMGFFYMFALMGHGALLYTRAHLSLRLSAFLEGFVLVHGSSVAFFGQRSPLWTMFFSGFGFMFVAAQLPGLKLPRPARIAAVAGYAAVVVALYSGALGGLGPLFSKSVSELHQALWIPVTLYGLVPAFVLLAAGLALIERAATRGSLKALPESREG